MLKSPPPAPSLLCLNIVPKVPAAVLPAIIFKSIKSFGAPDVCINSKATPLPALLISNLELGLVVPIPTSPSPLIVKAAVALV